MQQQGRDSTPALNELRRLPWAPVLSRISLSCRRRPFQASLFRGFLCFLCFLLMFQSGLAALAWHWATLTNSRDAVQQLDQQRNGSLMVLAGCKMGEARRQAGWGRRTDVETCCNGEQRGKRSKKDAKDVSMHQQPGKERAQCMHMGQGGVVGFLAVSGACLFWWKARDTVHLEKRQPQHNSNAFPAVCTEYSRAEDSASGLQVLGEQVGLAGDAWPERGGAIILCTSIHARSTRIQGGVVPSRSFMRVADGAPRHCDGQRGQGAYR